MKRLTPDKWLTLLFVGGLALYAAWTAYVVRADKPVDYYQYLIATYALSHGENIYVEPPDRYDQLAKELGIPDYQNAYQYPELTALIIWPMVGLPFRLSAAIFIFGSGVAALLAGLLLGAHAGAAWTRRLILAATVGFVPILTTLHAGQVNVFVLVAVSAALYAWRRASDSRAGAWLAVSLWLKPFAAPLVALALWRLRWRSLLGLLVVSAIVFLAGLALFGPAASIAQFNPGPGGLSRIGFPYPTNTNLNGFVSRWLMPGTDTVPLLNAPGLVLPLYLILGASSVLAAAFALWPPGTATHAFELEAALLIVLTHLIFPVTWYHHLTMTFVAFAVLLERWPDWRPRRWDQVLLVVAYAMLGIHGLFWHQLVGISPLLDLATWAELLVFALLVVGLRKWPLAQPQPAAVKVAVQA